MDRQEAIEILTEYKKWELDCNHCKSDLHTAIYYSSALVAKAIDTLIAPIPITDEMVERAAMAVRLDEDLIEPCNVCGRYELQELTVHYDGDIDLKAISQKILTAALGDNNATN